MVARNSILWLVKPSPRLFGAGEANIGQHGALHHSIR
jgi:hypothetical protein